MKKYVHSTTSCGTDKGYEILVGNHRVPTFQSSRSTYLLFFLSLFIEFSNLVMGINVTVNVHNMIFIHILSDYYHLFEFESVKKGTGIHRLEQLSG